MNLDYAVDRLYETGWHPSGGLDLESLRDGRRFPNLGAIHREFTRRGLRLEIQHKMMFNCYRATWSPANETPDADHVADESHGTVVGSSENEAAVYALAQLRVATAEASYVTAE